MKHSFGDPWGKKREKERGEEERGEEEKRRRGERRMTQNGKITGDEVRWRKTKKKKKTILFWNLFICIGNSYKQ